MNVSKIVWLLLKCLVEILLEAMRYEEKILDADGCPLNDIEYDKLSWFLCQIRQILNDYEKR